MAATIPIILWEQSRLADVHSDITTRVPPPSPGHQGLTLPVD